MNNQVTIAQLQQMKLKGMAEYYQSMETLSPENRPALDLFMAKMVEAEIQYRNRKRTEMYLRTSRLRYNTVMEDVICTEERNLTKRRYRNSQTVILSHVHRTCLLQAEQAAVSPSLHVP